MGTAPDNPQHTNTVPGGRCGTTLGDRQRSLAGLQKPSRAASTSRGGFRCTKECGFWDPSSSATYRTGIGAPHQIPAAGRPPPRGMPSGSRVQTGSPSHPIESQLHVTTAAHEAALIPALLCVGPTKLPLNTGIHPYYLSSWHGELSPSGLSSPGMSYILQLQLGRHDVTAIEYWTPPFASPGRISGHHALPTSGHHGLTSRLKWLTGRAETWDRRASDPAGLELHRLTSVRAR